MRKPWTDVEREYIRKHYPNTDTNIIAEHLGRTKLSVFGQANKMGVFKTKEFIYQMNRTNILKAGAKSRFRKGFVPWNKGMKGLKIGGEATQFKKGQDPHNTRPVGAYRITKDGTLQQKINNDSGNNSVRWRSVQELVWIEANGKVPPKHLIVFKAGMKTNVLEEITLDKLECLSFAENMARNSIHNYPPEIVSATRLLASLNRKINNGQKHK